MRQKSEEKNWRQQEKTAIGPNTVALHAMFSHLIAFRDSPTKAP
jgi:hypothetical protein